MQTFSISRAPHLLFGPETVAQLGPLLASRGFRRLVVITGKSLIADAEFAAGISENLRANDIEARWFRWDVVPSPERQVHAPTGDDASGDKASGNARAVGNPAAALNELAAHPSAVSEPSPDIVDAIALSCGQFPTAIAAIGGGSAIDTGKALSARLRMEGSVADYLEGVGTRQPGPDKVPFIAVPTTAGTGAEATKNAVLSRTGVGGFKKSLRHDAYVPDVAIIDPGLALGCPKQVTAASGLDALTQLLESYVSTRATPYTDALAITGLEHLGRSFVRAVERGESDIDARSGMAFAAYLSGICLANAGLGTVHGMAGPAGALSEVPHGVFCGTVLAPALDATISSLTRRRDALGALGKYAAAARALTGRTGGSLEDQLSALVTRVNDYLSVADLPPLRSYGITGEVAEQIAVAGNNKNNPYQFTADERLALLRAALGDL